jgi:Tfp pilus assembly protein FimT
MNPNSSRLQELGFSLIELLIVISISVMLTGLMLVNMRSYTDYAELEGEAYKIATLAREAQTYAVSTKTSYKGVSQNYPSVGIYFSGFPSSNIILFGEKTVNNIYDNTDEVIQTLTLTNGYTIVGICGSVNGSTCTTNFTTNTSVTYARPFVAMNIVGTPTGPGGYAAIIITLESQKLNIRHIYLWTTGQVTVS